MKVFYYIFFLLIVCTGNCFSQDSITYVFPLDKLSPEGVLLDTGWKFHIGDNPDYAKTDYNDGKWQTINPTLDIHELPQIKQGIVWFRLHLSIDSSIDNQLAMMIQQSGASEIYLNSHLIQRFGVLSDDPKKVSAYDPLWKPILFPINKDGPQVLAVRYALQPDIRYTTMFETANPAIWIKFIELNKAIDIYKKQTALVQVRQTFYVAVFTMLIILHIALYLFYPAQKASLYLTLYGFLYLIMIIIQTKFFLESLVAYKFYLSNLVSASQLVSVLFLLTAIYKLLNQKKDTAYWSLIALVVTSLFLNVWPYRWGWMIGGALAHLLIQINNTRVAFLAYKRKKRGAWIIVCGGVSCLIFLIIFLFLGTFTSHLYVLNFSLFRLAVNSISVLSIPAAISIYLGLEFAFTNRALAQKLVEVEKLSAKTIEQEKEKQQILSGQKEMLEKQVVERTSELSHSLKELKETQAQLVQREKMASLGELTAGIAHEIQNPLNFVNNFSEVNKELLEELKDEADKGNVDEVKAIASDVIENEQKINHHGKRADAIVKGMLQHSRQTTGIKEPTDINALADEYLRLSYHGMRARDKEFNVDIKTDFDETIGKINVTPQDIGRVILNLFNNAFYAVNEKKRIANKDYNPMVSVHTKKINDKIEIRVQDNGNGIPQKVVDKIFQPFFTTKPTGQGTGLGLSLSYDILKAHGGELKVETNEGEGSEFIAQLPITSFIL